MKTLVTKYQKAIQGVEQSRKSYEDFCRSADETNIALWAAQEVKALNNRSQDLSAMDIFDIQLKQGMHNYIYF